MKTRDELIAAYRLELQDKEIYFHCNDAAINLMATVLADELLSKHLLGEELLEAEEFYAGIRIAIHTPILIKYENSIL